MIRIVTSVGGSFFCADPQERGPSISDGSTTAPTYVGVWENGHEHARTRIRAGRTEAAYINPMHIVSKTIVEGD